MNFNSSLINLENLNRINEFLKNYPSCEFLIVTKNQPIDAVRQLIEQGYTFFGENKVQEAQKKYSSIKNKNIQLHLIGPLQTNKTKEALSLFDTIQTIDRTKLIDEIIKNFNTNSITKEFYIQVNIGNEPQKSGVAQPDLETIYSYAIDKGLNIKGLMCIPPVEQDSMKYFKMMHNLKNKLNPALKLSMGMSNDYVKALQCGSDLIRIGSLVFQ